MDSLPIDAHLDAICATLERTRALVLVAEPGAGKTTRLPPALIDRGVAGDGEVLVLEPRRVAARAAARRIASERGDEVGGFAGYQVRFDSKVSRRTRVRLMTEGILARRIQDDPELAGVSAVVLDEFHERSIHADLALALLADVRRSLRPELAIVVMSATLEAEPVARFLGDAPIVRVPGRAHPLEIEELATADDRPLHLRVADGVRAMLAKGSGDVLAFLPGVGEILRARDELARTLRDVDVLALYGDQAADEQDRALARGPRRKIVLATNVAETSLTVPGVTAVVDCGLARVLTHDPDVGLDRLELRPISRASATQRAGRAGRIGPGRVLRLWTRIDAQKMPEREAPEIARVDLAPTLLELATWGVRDFAAFPWLEAPDRARVERATELLVSLGALDASSRAPTAIGKRLSALPCHPRLGRMLIEAAERGAISDGAVLAALLSERDVFASRRDRARELAVGPSDLLARRDAWLAGDASIERNVARAVERTAEELARATKRLMPGADDRRADDATLLRVIFAGFPDRVARRRARGGDEAVMVGGRGLTLGQESVVRDAELFVVIDADLGARGLARGRIRQASAIERAWLEAIPGAVREQRSTELDPASGRAVGRKLVLYRDLALEAVETGAPDRAVAAELLLEHVRAEGERALDLGGEVGRWLARARSLAGWAPELGLPALDVDAIVDALAPWLDGKTSIAEVRALPLLDVLRSRLSREQARALDELAPDVLDLPSGSTRRLEYEPGKPPVLAVRLQELFGLARTPTVARGRVAVLLHLLAPNQRVVQVTQDLASFWNNTYPQVRKDLRARYPRHSWPDDPWSATPTARPARRPRG